MTALMLLLVLARTRGAGPYGIAAVPVLLAYFVTCGVLAGRAVYAVSRRLPRMLAWGASVVGALAATAGSGLTWARTGSDQPLLPPLFAWAAALALLWAVVAPPRERRGALATAVLAAVVWLWGIAVDVWPPPAS